MMRQALVAGALGFVALCALVPSASAELEGPCDGTVAGQDVDFLGLDASDAVAVDPDEVVPYSFSSSSAVTHFDAQASYGPYTATVDEGVPDDGASSVNGTMDVGRFSEFGVGLYKITAHASLADGSTCKAEFLVHVQGSALSSSAGQASAALAVLAGGGLVAISVMTTTGVKTVLASLTVA
ncbi:MAG: hypothetical protein WC876_04700 [Candidatus Thermoplasmatota archaeon]|jgi:hypothetical protein